MISWPDDLVRDVAARRAVLFIGAGVSRNSVGKNNKVPPGWIAFLDNAIDHAKTKKKISNKDATALRKLVEQRDLLTVCDVVKSVFSPNEFGNLIKQAYLAPGYKPAPIHDHIGKLDCRVVLTPNFDQIYDGHALVQSGNSAVVKTYEDSDLAEALREDDRVIVKMHGSASSPHELIFTRSDYASARSKHRTFYLLIESLLRTHTFLFLGCGLDDPDIRTLLENYTYDHEHSRKHYFALPNNVLTPKILEVISRSLNLEFLVYSPKEKHKELSAGLKALVQKVEAKRTTMADTQTW